MPAYLVLLGDYLNRFPLGGIKRCVLFTVGVFGLVFCIAITGFLAKNGRETDFVLGATHACVVLFSAAVFTLFETSFGNRFFLKRHRYYVSEVAKNTFGIYLTHRMFIWIIPAIPGPVVLDIVFRSAASFSLSLVATALLRRIPVLRVIVT